MDVVATRAPVVKIFRSHHWFNYCDEELYNHNHVNYHVSIFENMGVVVARQYPKYGRGCN